MPGSYWHERFVKHLDPVLALSFHVNLPANIDLSQWNGSPQFVLVLNLENQRELGHQVVWDVELECLVPMRILRFMSHFGAACLYNATRNMRLNLYKCI